MTVATPTKKARILALHKHGIPDEEICREVGLKRRTFYNAKASVLKTGNPYFRHKPTGRPRLLSPHSECQAVCAIQKGKTETAANTQRTLVPGVSSRTVGRVLDCAGYHARMPRKVPLLTAKDRWRRLAWAIEHREWTQDDWNKVCFLDESKFNLVGSDGMRWCRRKDGDALKDQYVKPRVQQGGGHVMVWGCITRHGFGRISRCIGKINAAAYIETLDTKLLPSFTDLDLDPHTILFQQDGSTVHTANKTCAFLESHHIKILPWPPKSPDLNLIEHVWDYLQTAVGKRPRKPKNLDALWAALEEEWGNLDQRYLDSLYEGMH